MALWAYQCKYHGTTSIQHLFIPTLDPQNRVQMGQFGGPDPGFGVQNGSKMGPIWEAILDLVPEVSTRWAVCLFGASTAPWAPCG